MKAYVTKYALTTGVLKIEAEDCGDGMIADKGGRFTAYYHGEGRDWHRTRAAAVERAKEMRLLKIASLKKQIAKLQKARFE